MTLNEVPDIVCANYLTLSAKYLTWVPSTWNWVQNILNWVSSTWHFVPSIWHCVPSRHGALKSCMFSLLHVLCEDSIVLLEQG